jgi:hypothetical protein
MAFRLIPREERFFDDFKALGDELMRGSQLLEAMLAPDHPEWTRLTPSRKSSTNAISLRTKLFNGSIGRLSPHWIAKTSTHSPGRSTTSWMRLTRLRRAVRLYQLDTVRFGARELAAIVSASTHQVRLAIEALEHHKGLMTNAIEINRLENEADRVHQQAVSRLFDEERDSVAIMKWKETLDFLEEATDRCEDAANVLEGVMVKHG